MILTNSRGRWPRVEGGRFLCFYAVIACSYNRFKGSRTPVLLPFFCRLKKLGWQGFCTILGVKQRLMLNLNPVLMNLMLKNDQDFLAERFSLLEEQTLDQAKMAMLKIRSWQFSQMNPEVGEEYQNGIREVLEKYLFQLVPPSFVLSEEGYYFSVVEN